MVNAPRKSFPSHPTLLAARLLDAATDYCIADDLARRARDEWASLVAHHANRSGLVCSATEEVDTFSDEGESEDTVTTALPESEWCDYCREYQRTGTSAFGAGAMRRAARQRMRRAHADIVALRPSLAKAIKALHMNGVIRKRFRATEIDAAMRGVFSAREIRHWFASDDGSQCRRVAKYTYEIRF